jgi:hypothetical protein
VTAVRDRLSAVPERPCEVCSDSGLVRRPSVIPGTTARHVALRYCGCDRGRALQLRLRAG